MMLTERSNDTRSDTMETQVDLALIREIASLEECNRQLEQHIEALQGEMSAMSAELRHERSQREGLVKSVNELGSQLMTEARKSGELYAENVHLKDEISEYENREVQERASLSDDIYEVRLHVSNLLNRLNELDGENRHRFARKRLWYLVRVLTGEVKDGNA
jgi:chromosome segregation ATPase